MTLLAGIRNLIARRRSPDTEGIDPDDLPADKLADEIDVDPDMLCDDIEVVAGSAIEPKPSATLLSADGRRPARGENAENEDRRMAEMLAQIESRFEEQEAGLERAVRRLDERLETQAGAMERLGSQLDDRMARQATETSRVAEQVETLAQSASEIGEIRKRSDEVLETIREGAAAAKARDEALAEAVTQRIGDAVSELAESGRGAAERVEGALNKLIESGRNDDSEALAQISGKLDSTARAVREYAERSAGVGERLNELAETSGTLKQAMAKMSRAVEARETELTRMLARNKRSMTMFAFACTLAALMALAVAVIAIFI